MYQIETMCIAIYTDSVLSYLQFDIWHTLVSYTYEINQINPAACRYNFNTMCQISSRPILAQPRTYVTPSYCLLSCPQVFHPRFTFDWTIGLLGAQIVLHASLHVCNTNS